MSDEELAIIVDAYSRPGAFGVSLAYYRARAGAKDAKAAGPWLASAAFVISLFATNVVRISIWPSRHSDVRSYT